MTNTLILARLDLPRPGIAEDAPALAEQHDGAGLIGVFDGLGGAGARGVEGEDGRRSSAYYAARLARAAVSERFAVGGIGHGEATTELSLAITDALARRHATAPPAAGWVRSRLIRSYPTTAALLLAEPAERSVHALAMWAGDSRCYLMTPDHGLQQVSRDDSAGGSDFASELGEGARMTNVLCADRPGQLNSRAHQVNGPVLLIAATDGAYGCHPYPMHFELALLDALAEAQCEESWAAGLAAQMAPLADDDVSLAAAFAGWRSIPAAAASFAPRRERLRSLLRAPLADAWERYRLGYLACAA